VLKEQGNLQESFEMVGKGKTENGQFFFVGFFFLSFFLSVGT
jgi:hypothetical protein